ncbi:MAG: N-acetylneuraminate synthase family protein [Planctomycetota bacterium]
MTWDFHHADADRPAAVAVITEVGVNHDGDPRKAEHLVRAAADAGADAVKFQLFRPDRLLSAEARLAAYQDGQADDAAALLDQLTLTVDELRGLRDTAHAANLAFVVTPFSPADADDLATIGVDAVKIASPDAVNPPLLDAAAALGRPVLVSTGTCDLDELDHAADVARATGGALLHCVSAYPTPEPDAALGGIAALRRRFPGVRVGYSDHTAALDTGALGVAAGACVLEKHLTHDRQAAGPDHAASVEPDGLQAYVAAVRRAAAMLGSIAKTCSDAERDVRDVSRQSVCLVADRPAGHRLTAADLTVKRPGSGVPARQRDVCVGRRLTRDVAGDRPLRPDDLDPPPA